MKNTNNPTYDKENGTIKWQHTMKNKTKKENKRNEDIKQGKEKEK